MYKYRESQEKYLSKFKRIVFRLHWEDDADLIAWLDGQSSRNQFLKDLVEKEFLEAKKR